MTACTDDERRRVAKELRGLKRNGHNVTQLNHGPTLSLAWCVLGDELSACVPGDWFERMCARLADLIEPPARCPHYMYPCCRTDAGGNYIDRDALLALAACVRKMGEDYDKLSAFGLGTTFRAIADRIREACGEVVE